MNHITTTSKLGEKNINYNLIIIQRNIYSNNYYFTLIPYLTQEGLIDYSQGLGIYNKSDRDEHLLLMKRAKGTLIIVRERDESGGKGTSGSRIRKVKARASFYSKYLTPPSKKGEIAKEIGALRLNCNQLRQNYAKTTSKMTSEKI